jgi:hypothetical protein
MTRKAASAFDRYSEEVEGMMCDGEPLDEVEGAIERLPLPEEQKAALWLVAWSLGERPVWRRSLARQATPIAGRP